MQKGLLKNEANSIPAVVGGTSTVTIDFRKMCFLMAASLSSLSSAAVIGSGADSFSCLTVASRELADIALTSVS